MKRIVSILLFVFFTPSSFYAQTDSLWRGIYLSGEIAGINYDTLKHSLHLNVVEGATGYSWLSPGDTLMLTNTTGIKVINENVGLAHKLSAAQRIEYEAEQNAPLPGEELLKNYFDYRHPEKFIVAENESTSSLRLSVGAQAGTVVSTAVPNDEYHYGSKEWLATFRIKAEYPQSAIPTTWVVKCSIIDNGVALKESTLTVSMFPGSGVYRDFILPFTLNPPPDSPPPFGVLTGAPIATNTSHQVDLRVFWYGNHTTYLDKVIVEDTLAHSLFAGVYDTVIRDTALHYARPSFNHEAFYLKDEPYMSMFLAHNYVSNQIKAALGENDPRARTVVASNQRFARFLTDGQPWLIMIPYLARNEPVRH